MGHTSRNGKKKKTKIWPFFFTRFLVLFVKNQCWKVRLWWLTFCARQFVSVACTCGRSIKLIQPFVLFIGEEWTRVLPCRAQIQSNKVFFSSSFCEYSKSQMKPADEDIWTFSTFSCLHPCFGSPLSLKSSKEQESSHWISETDWASAS